MTICIDHIKYLVETEDDIRVLAGQGVLKGEKDG